MVFIHEFNEYGFEMDIFEGLKVFGRQVSLISFKPADRFASSRCLSGIHPFKRQHNRNGAQDVLYRHRCDDTVTRVGDLYAQIAVEITFSVSRKTCQGFFYCTQVPVRTRKEYLRPLNFSIGRKQLYGFQISGYGCLPYMLIERPHKRCNRFGGNAPVSEIRRGPFPGNALIVYGRNRTRL